MGSTAMKNNYSLSIWRIRQIPRIMQFNFTNEAEIGISTINLLAHFYVGTQKSGSASKAKRITQSLSTSIPLILKEWLKSLRTSISLFLRTETKTLFKARPFKRSQRYHSNKKLPHSVYTFSNKMFHHFEITST